MTEIKANQVRMHRNINGNYSLYIIVYDPRAKQLRAVFFRTNEESSMMLTEFKPRSDDPLIMNNLNKLSTLMRTKGQELLNTG